MARPHIWRCLLSAILLMGTACSYSGRPGAEVVSRDSAGVRIVEGVSPVVAPPPEWTLDTMPAMVVTEAGDEPLHRVAGLVRLTNGEVVVASNGSSRLDYFDAAGRHVRSAGRRGQGPGEFGTIEGLYQCAADTVIGNDARRQMEVFGPDGGYGRVVPVSPPPSGGFVRILGMAGDCVRLAISVERLVPLTRTEGLVHIPVSIWWVGPEGEFVDSVITIPSPRLGARPPSSPEGRPWVSRLPWDGAPAFVATGDRLFIGLPDRFEILAYDLAGGLREILRVPGAREPISRAERDEYERRLEEYLSQNPDSRRTTPKAADFELPPERPAFQSMVIAEDGGIWLREVALADAGWPEVFRPGPDAPHVRWYVLGRDGAWLGQIRLPARLTVRAVAGDFVYGIFRDEDDAEQMRGYRFQRR